MIAAEAPTEVQVEPPVMASINFGLGAQVSEPNASDLVEPDGVLEEPPIPVSKPIDFGLGPQISKHGAAVFDELESEPKQEPVFEELDDEMLP